LLCAGALTHVAHAQDDQPRACATALAAPDAPAANKARDADRKPIETVQSSHQDRDTVVDMIAVAAGSPKCSRAAGGPARPRVLAESAFVAETEAEKAAYQAARQRRSAAGAVAQGEHRGKDRRRVTAMNLHDNLQRLRQPACRRTGAVELLGGSTGR